MTGYLTTHVLDTANGAPAQGMKIDLYRLDPDRRLIAQTTTNHDGRTDSHILPADQFQPGEYELVFHVGDWLDAQGHQAGKPRFLDTIPLRFGMSEQDHYHVPLLISPYGYSTYRGS
ncbi:hydroxyisourate hydrolase [Paracoccus shanxieyensis]|uniref:5-hydroxyisourate hydrolase n=1 Tax=Paracoccus shanxieyensis TaxID=2675752 RepID=A0A6L6IZ01_9RHOB|nr:hydroxyisourate hydrolase [Paracoccus shanxieyensis]MTH63824.1 hydroxyisourate hydrolase [Paracoccus shanxieyensis]MTH86665.1 hydroxyisourate hydrolase [Paracoccus shanxieyensis]